ncbi:MAG: PAS domain S-box protein [Planctomycetes bacterium]|nr:PAS domain S-box protein [Planctomycetota bacterium]NOG55759.1 PAS domain S-box protein [Planctomycetota bacterium]
MTHVIRARQLLRLEIAVGLLLVLSIVSVLMLAGGYFAGLRQADHYWPILSAVHNAERELLQRHLVYEDALASGNSDGVPEIWAAFDRIAGLFERQAATMPSSMPGRSGPEQYTLLSDELTLLSNRVSECKAIAQRNWNLARSSDFSLPHDEEFDHVFDDLMGRMDQIHALLASRTVEGFRTGSRVFNFTWPLWLIVVLFTWAVLILGLRRLDGVARELAESEGRYRALVDALPIGVLHTDEQGRCTYANRGWADMVGQPVSQALDHGWASVLDEETKPVALKAWFGESTTPAGTMSSGPFPEPSWRFTDAQGEPVHVSVEVGSYEAPGRPPGRQYVLAIMNHSQQHLAERALAESEARYRSLVELAPDAILVQTEGIVRYANAATVRLFGADHVDELLGRPLEELVRTDYQQAVSNRLQRALSGESDGEPMEQVAMGLNGKQIPIEARSTQTLHEGRPATLAYIRDIAKQKKTESALRFERSLLHMLMDNVPDLIYFKDRQCRFLRVNSAMASSLGVSEPNRLVGRSHGEFDDPWQAQMRYADEQLLLETGEPLVGRLERGGTDKGSTRWYSTTKVPLSNGSGSIIGLVGVSRDITKQRQIDEALSRSEVRFRQLAESIDEAFWLTAPDGSETFYLNPAYERITGQSGDVLMADPQAWRALVHPEDTSIADSQLLMGDGHTWSESDRGVEFRLLLPGDDVRWVWLRTRVVHDESGETVALAGVMVDITKRKRAELAIEGQWEFLQAVIDGLPDPLVVYDRNRQIRMANSKMQQRAGSTVTTCAHVCDRVWGCPPETGQCKECAVTTAFETGRPHTSERGAVSQDGTPLHLEISAAPILDQHGVVNHVIASFRDVTDRRRSEDALRESEVRFRHFFEMSPVSKLLVDEDGVVRGMNNRFAEKTGFREETLIGCPIGEFLFKQMAVAGTTVREPLRFQDVKEARNVNAELVVESGDSLDVLLSGNQTDDLAGRAITMLVVRDITEQKRAERISQYRLRLEQLLARISTRFINLSASEIDSGISSAIADAGTFLQADLTTVMLYEESTDTLGLHCSWTAVPDSESVGRPMTLKMSEVPWLAREFEQNRVVVIHDVDQMGPEALSEQRLFLDLGMKSAVVVPLKSEGRLLGCICARSLESIRRWDEPDTGLMRMISEMISEALIRKSSYEELQNSQLRYRRLATSRQMLLEELNHRVLNNLTSLMTLVTMMERSGRSTSEFVEALRGRLGAFTAVHQVIAGRGWQEVELRALLQNLVGKFEPNREVRQRIELAGPPVLVKPKAAQTIAVIVQELLTNCRKYGAHSVPEGTVQFTWEITDQHDDCVHVAMLWSERGGPSPDRHPTSSHGLGIRLVRGFVSFELRGRCEFDFLAHGLECRITCVLETGRFEDDQRLTADPDTRAGEP